MAKCQGNIRVVTFVDDEAVANCLLPVSNLASLGFEFQSSASGILWYYRWGLQAMHHFLLSIKIA